jgi:hypothetical protein
MQRGEQFPSTQAFSLDSTVRLRLALVPGLTVGVLHVSWRVGKLFSTTSTWGLVDPLGVPENGLDACRQSAAQFLVQTARRKARMTQGARGNSNESTGNSDAGLVVDGSNCCSRSTEASHTGTMQILRWRNHYSRVLRADENF